MDVLAALAKKLLAPNPGPPCFTIVLVRRRHHDLAHRILVRDQRVQDWRLRMLQLLLRPAGNLIESWKGSGRML